MSETDRSIIDYNLAQIAEACATAEWHLGDAAALLGVSRNALKEKIERTPELILLQTDHQEIVVDDAERIIKLDLKAKDSATAKFVAQTQGKNRGWATAGINKDGAVIVEVRTFAEPAKGEPGGDKG